jgi:L-lactate dehydrogenase (cytochrome)
MSISRYFTDMLDPSLSWQDVAQMVEEWNGQFCLKGVMSAEDARRAVEIGCTGIVLSNHGGRQLDGSRTAFEQLAEVVDAVGDRIDVIMDGGVRRGSHVLKALSLGAKAVGLGRYYLFPLAVAGQAGVEHALELMRTELVRDMKLMGCTSIDQLIPSPNEDDSSQFQSTGDVIQHGKRGGLLCRHRWRSDLITMPLA